MPAVKDLSNEQLDMWVAKAQGWEILDCPTDGEDVWGHFKKGYETYVTYASDYSPTTNWSQCGELIEKFDIQMLGSSVWVKGNSIDAIAFEKDKGSNVDLKRAICEAVVLSKFGEEVKDVTT